MTVGHANRDNKGKVDHTLHYIPALEEMAKVWMKGRDKYGRDNWQKLWGEDTVNVAMASLFRHAFSILQGETYDKETAQMHAAHIMCNCCMLIKHELDTKKKENDDENKNATRDLFGDAFSSKL